MSKADASISDGAYNDEDLFLDCLMSHPDGIAVLEDTGALVFSNKRYNEMFFDPGEEPQPGETALQVLRRIVDGGRVAGLDQVDPNQAVLNMAIDCFSFVQDAEFALTNGRVIQINSSPTQNGRIMMTFRDTRRDRLGERRAAELLSEGLGSADMGMVLWDAALNVQLVNPAWQSLTMPLQLGDDVAVFLRDLIDGEVLPSPEGFTAEDFARKKIAEIHSMPTQFLLNHPDGRHVQISTFGITSGGVMATAVDVSQQYNAEERARALLRDAVEALEIGVLHFDPELHLIMSNRAARDMIFQDQPHPAVGTSLGEIVDGLVKSGVVRVPHADSRAELVASFEDAAKAYEKHRRIRWQHDQTLEFSSDPTEMGGYLVSVKDLTDTLRAEQEAREANDLVKTSVDASPTTFLFSKVETGEVVLATGASRQRFGKIKTTLEFFLDPQDRETYLSALLPTGSLDDYPVRFRRQDGSIMEGLTSARVIEYKGEQMIVSSTRDITDFLAMQRELEVQRHNALQNEKLSALGELLAGVAHELSNPLSVVVGYAMMLADKDLDDNTRRKLDRITIAAERCVRIVKMFLALAREKPSALELSQISDLLEAAIAVSTGDFEREKISLNCDIPARLPSVLVDPDHITQVFSNLVVNAGHAVRGHNTAPCINVLVGFNELTDRLVIDVKDNGPGVPESIRHRIFEPFFTTKDVGKGTGIGLALSHRVVAAHGGTLTLKTSNETGAWFRVELPVANSYTRRDARDPNAPSGRSAQEHLLVVDDEAAVGEVLHDILSDAGYRVDVVQNGHTALDKCAETRFAAILCDMRMPDIDGEAFYRSLTAVDESLARRVLFLTGETMDSSVAEFIKESGRLCLEKPILPEELLTQLAAVLAQEIP